MAKFRYSREIQDVLHPWQEKLGADFYLPVSILRERDRQIEDFVSRHSGAYAPGATFPSPASEGQLFYETDTDKLWAYDGTNWVELARSGAWTDYTPAWTQSATISKTIPYARWLRWGRTILCQGVLIATSAGTAGNELRVTYPVTPVTPVFRTIGTFDFYDASTNLKDKGSAIMYGSVSTHFAFQDASTRSSNSLGTGTSAFVGAVASGDELSWNIIYEALAST